MSKRPLACLVYEVAEKKGIQQTTVKLIIETFLADCVDDIKRGLEVKILGLVTIKPLPRFSNEVKTFALRCKGVATILNLPYFTVYYVLREYVDILVDELYRGNLATMRGLVKIYPSVVDRKLTNVYCLINPKLKEALYNGDTGVKSARSHICRYLRREVAGGVAD